MNTSQARRILQLALMEDRLNTDSKEDMLRRYILDGVEGVCKLNDTDLTARIVEYGLHEQNDEVNEALETLKGCGPQAVRSQRHKNATICQEGASNERRVASSLVEAIDECRKEMADPRTDPAVFLILHQLTFLLTGHDLPSAAGWLECMTEVRRRAQDQQP